MKTLVYHDRRGPAVVFLPPKGDAVPQSAAAPGGDLNKPAYTQVASRGPRASWADHCRNLVSAPPYAGRWTVEDVPDGCTATQALRHVREAASMSQFREEKTSA